ncbi:MAG: ATP-binding cassette domain-containing protein [Planctomycetes bacterium]|nr:ATP-binding cassette domain-containing protein [Planctomycetota bacterium]
MQLPPQATDPDEPATPPLLELTDVRVGRGRLPVLDGVELSIRAGEHWFVVGPNGSGKSTLLMTALGLLRPRHGRVLRSPALQGSRHVGYVPQRVTLDAALPTTVAEFLALGLVGSGVRRMQRRVQIGAALMLVGLAGREARPFWQHSEGERQRLLLARALARRPRLLVMDEPTASLDPRTAEDFWSLVARLAEDEELAVVCATHDLRAAARLATDIALCTLPAPGERTGGVVHARRGGPAPHDDYTIAFGRAGALLSGAETAS